MYVGVCTALAKKQHSLDLPDLVVVVFVVVFCLVVLDYSVALNLSRKHFFAAW